MFYRKAGRFTQEEVELAIQSKIETGRPRAILICFLKNIHLPQFETDTKTLEQFRNKYYKEYKNYFHEYENIESVESSIKTCLFDLIPPQQYLQEDTLLKSSAVIEESTDTIVKQDDSNREDAKDTTETSKINKKESTTKTTSKKTERDPWETVVTLIIAVLFFGGFSIWIYYFGEKYGYGEGYNSGYCGESITWSLADGVLEFQGSGYMKDWMTKHTPWYDDRNNITEVIFDNRIQGIGKHTLSGFSNLSTITLPDSICFLSEKSFENCSNLSTVNISDSVTYIDSQAFDGCYNLQEFIVDPKNKSYASIDGILFDYNREELVSFPCGKKISEYEIPSGTTKIQSYAFSKCGYLVTIVMPDSVMMIGEGAFSDCVGLRNIVLSEGIKSIESKTFQNCKSLKTITIPTTVDSVETKAFDDCVGLENVYFTSDDVPKYEYGDGKDPFGKVTATLYYPAQWGKTSFMKNDDRWVEYNP